MLAKNNRTDTTAAFYESDTQEISFDGNHNRFIVRTPRSLGVCLPKGPDLAEVRELTVENLGASLALLLSSLTSDPIASSQRLLLVLSGNALNSDMVFEDATMGKLVHIGKAPTLMQALNVRLSIRLAGPDTWELWALAQNGKRVERLPLKVVDGKVTVLLNTANLKNGPTPYFEIVRK